MKQKILFSALVVLLPLSAQADLEFNPFPFRTTTTESISVFDMTTSVLIKPVTVIKLASPIVNSGEVLSVIQQNTTAKLKDAVSIGGG